MFKSLGNVRRNLKGCLPYFLILDFLFLLNGLSSSQLFGIQFSLSKVIKIYLCYSLRVYIPGFQTWHLFYNVHLHSTNHDVGQLQQNSKITFISYREDNDLHAPCVNQIHLHCSKVKACLHVIKVKDNFPGWASKCADRLYEVYARQENTQVSIMEPSHSKWQALDVPVQQEGLASFICFRAIL